MNDYGDNLIKCPLLNKSIAEGYCYDINMVRTKQIKKDILKEDINVREANGKCLKCDYRPF